MIEQSNRRADRRIGPLVPEAAPGALASLLAERNAEGNIALMQGDAATHALLLPLSDDFVLMSPFGGEPSRAAACAQDGYERMARFFRNGDFSQQVVAAYESHDMVTLVTIEHTNAEIGGMPAQSWALRVTLVFTREGSRWRLAHRHADPLVDDVPLLQAARLARGGRDFDGI